MSKTIKENERQLLNTGDVLVFAFGAMIGWGWVVLSGQWDHNRRNNRNCNRLSHWWFHDIFCGALLC